ncbi:MAG: hypothetical protein ACJ75J_10030 [Cytophagaceae bacterium]
MPQADFENLKGYAGYLLDNKLHDLVLFSIIRAKEENLFIIKGQSDKKLRIFLEKSHTKFLTDIIEANPIDAQLALLYAWVNADQSGFPSRTIKHTEIIKAYNIRKKVTLAFVEEYTPNLFYQKAIRNEMNILLHIIEKMTLQLL